LKFDKFKIDEDDIDQDEGSIKDDDITDLKA